MRVDPPSVAVDPAVPAAGKWHKVQGKNHAGESSPWELDLVATVQAACGSPRVADANGALQPCAAHACERLWPSGSSRPASLPPLQFDTVVGCHHKTGTHLGRALRNLIAARLSASTSWHRRGRGPYSIGVCDDDASARHAKPGAPAMAPRLWMLCRLGSPPFGARGEQYRMVHFVRRPSRMAASQHLYLQRLLAGGPASYADGVAARGVQAFVRALRAGDAAGMWAVTMEHIVPKAQEMLGAMRASAMASARLVGRVATLDIDTDIGEPARFDAAMVRVLQLVLPPGAAAHHICALRLAATSQDVSRSHNASAAFTSWNRASHVSAPDDKAKALSELKRLPASAARLDALDAQFDEALRLLRTNEETAQAL